jgi:hypothetical protein
MTPAALSAANILAGMGSAPPKLEGDVGEVALAAAAAASASSPSAGLIGVFCLELDELLACDALLIAR